MPEEDLGAHEKYAERLRKSVAESGLSDQELRLAVYSRAGGGAPVPEPFEALVDQIGRDSSRVTDAHVKAVHDATGSEMATFEIILTAAIGAGVTRWERALTAIADADDATP